MLTRTLLGLFLLRQIRAVLYPTNEKFTKLVDEQIPMLVGFTAMSWSPNCKRVPKVFTRVEALFQKEGIDIKVVILDDSEDSERKHRTAYNADGYPAMLFVKGRNGSKLKIRSLQGIVDDCVEKMQDCQGDLTEHKKPLQQILDTTMETFFKNEADLSRRR
ncbi:MAG: uncharacterized protein A8A55_0323 [Amphiamblys sp. WSBS2006]|nr:MAG: uncharacterized protein A8A55_0323 [Amphiamblys sp. WSBS2006]